MKPMYLIYDEFYNYIEIYSDTISPIMSGDLRYIDSLKPKFYKSKVGALLKAWLYNLQLIEVKFKDLGNVGNFIDNTYKYNWLMFKEGKHEGLVVKVYNRNKWVIPSNSSSQKDGEVIIKGVGTFPIRDFIEVDWN